MQAAQEARKKKQQAEQAKHAEHEAEDWGSMPGQLTKALALKEQMKKGKKAKFAEAAGADGAVQVSVKQGAGHKVCDFV